MWRLLRNGPPEDGLAIVQAKPVGRKVAMARILPRPWNQLNIEREIASESERKAVDIRGDFTALF
jgi:hypothetical protein